MLVWTSGGVDDIFGFILQLQPHLPPPLSLLSLPSSNLPRQTMSLVHITSKEQFSSLLGAAVFVVADCEWFFVPGQIDLRNYPSNTV